VGRVFLRGRLLKLPHFYISTRMAITHIGSGLSSVAAVERLMNQITVEE
jgi:hypothetical protein